MGTHEDDRSVTERIRERLRYLRLYWELYVEAGQYGQPRDRQARAEMKRQARQAARFGR